MAIWDNLSVLEEIARRIKSLEDFTAFGGVCRLSRTATVDNNFKFSRIPWLLLPPKSEPPIILDEELEFLSLYTQQIYLPDERKLFSLSKGMYREINLADTKAKRCYSSKGWLLVIDLDLNCRLLHPISNVRVELPDINTLIFKYGPYECARWVSQICCIQKFVLSASPSLTSDYTVLILFKNTELAYFRPGFQYWVKIDISRGCYRYHDVIYHEGKFYAVNDIGGIVAIDIKTDLTVKCEKVAELPYTGTGRGYQRLYLAEFGRKLLLLHRKTLPDEEYDDYIWVGTFEFDVFELDLRNGNWWKITDLGSSAIFLGFNSSVTVEILENRSVLKSNCVYFTDDEVEMSILYGRPEDGPIPPSGSVFGKDVGVYNLRDGVVEKIVMPE